MKQVTVATTATLLCVAGNREFVAIYNNDANPIFLQFDGTDDTGATLTTSNGFPLASNQWMSLNNDNHRNIFNKSVFAISVAGGADVRLQGVS